MPQYTPSARVDGAHEEGIWSLSWTATDRVCTGGVDEHLGVFTAAGAREARLRAAHVGVVSVAAHPKDAVVATNAVDCTVRFWDVSADAGGDEGTPATEEGYKQLVSSIEAGAVEAWALAYSPDGRRVASGTQAGALNVWDVDTGNVAARMETQDQFVLSVAYSPGGDLVACGGVDGT
mmetsp:Transcript_42480/g.133170  ORF Transcript_42480/g.133170 Transcript_42480/m.133170 type:complete len:178 (-) Transcript_42480:145-678(-)